MTTLTHDTPRDYELGLINEVGVAANTVIYEGAAVGEALGFARPLQAGDRFLGFAEQGVDNLTGLDGDKRVRVKVSGKVKLAVSSVALTDIGQAVFASDDDTFTLTQGNNSFIGRVYRIESMGLCVVAFDATRAGSGSVPLLTDNSGGTPSNTIAAIGATYDQAEVANAIASLTAQLNALCLQTK